MIYNKEDILTFKSEICKEKCVLKGKCIEENKNDHWFLMCPHYHKWKFGYESVWETEGVIIKNKQKSINYKLSDKA